MKYLTIDRISATSMGILNEAGFGAAGNIGKTSKGAYSEAQQVAVTNINQQISTLLNRTLSEITNSINQILTPEELKIANINKSISQSQKAINSFMSNLQSQYKTLDISDQKNTMQILETLFNKLIIAIQSTEKLNNNIDILGTLNAIAAGLTAGKQSKQYKGDISEALIAVIGNRLAGQVIENVNGTIESAIVSGGERSSRGINVEYFSKDIN